jgi:hypothetical protein
MERTIMPSFNEHTGARISSGSHVKGTDKEAFDAGWDAIFGKKPNAKTLATEELESGRGERFDSVESLMVDLEDDTDISIEIEDRLAIFRADAKCRIEVEENCDDTCQYCDKSTW